MATSIMTTERAVYPPTDRSQVLSDLLAAPGRVPASGRLRRPRTSRSTHNRQRLLEQTLLARRAQILLRLNSVWRREARSFQALLASWAEHEVHETLRCRGG